MCGFIDIKAESSKVIFDTIMSSSRFNLENYFWLGTDIDDNVKRHLQSDSEKSVFENLISMAENFGAWLEFKTDSNGKIGIFLRKNAIDRGKFIKKGRDLKSINVNYNTDEIFTVMTPFGASSLETGEELNIMAVNNGVSYVENYDWYIASGVDLETIKKSPRYQQECVFRNNTIDNAHELMELAKRELEICSKPKLTGNITIYDLSIKEGSSLLTPIIGEKIVVFDKDINFNIETTIIGVERDYDNPLNTTIEISNIIKYDSIFKDLVNKGEIIDKVTGGSGGNTVVNGNYIQGLIDANVAKIVGQLNNIGEIRDATILFECRIIGHELFGAVAIGSRGLLCSTRLDVKNQWIWTTAISSEGVSADSIVALTIHAGQIIGGMLSSINKNTWINMNDGTFNFGDKITFNGTTLSIAGYATIDTLKGYATFKSLESSGQTVINGDNITTGMIRSRDLNTWINMMNGTFSFANKINFDGSQLTLNDIDVIGIKDGNMNGNKLKSCDFMEVRPQINNGRMISIYLPSAFYGKNINTDFKVVCTYGAIDSNVNAVFQKDAIRNIFINIVSWNPWNRELVVQPCLQKIGVATHTHWGWNSQTTTTGNTIGEGAIDVVVMAQI